MCRAKDPLQPHHYIPLASGTHRFHLYKAGRGYQTYADLQFEHALRGLHCSSGLSSEAVLYRRIEVNTLIVKFSMFRNNFWIRDPIYSCSSTLENSTVIIVTKK